MPLGEDLMVTYIDFCRGNIQTIGQSWFTNALSNSSTLFQPFNAIIRQRYISATCGMAILRDVPHEVMFRVLIERINIVCLLPWVRATHAPRENQLDFVMAGN